MMQSCFPMPMLTVQWWLVFGKQIIYMQWQCNFTNMYHSRKMFDKYHTIPRYFLILDNTKVQFEVLK